MKKELKPGDQMEIMESSQVQRYVVSKNDKGELVTSKFMLRHKMINSDEEILFDTNKNRGTIRLMDILPILTSDEGQKIYIIDELDRSLHPNLCYQLIHDFLAKSGQSQIIVTTHESNLLTFDILKARRNLVC